MRKILNPTASEETCIAQPCTPPQEEQGLQHQHIALPPQHSSVHVPSSHQWGHLQTLGFSPFFLALRTTGICAMLCWEAQLQCIFLLSLLFGDKDFKSVSAFHLLLRCKRGLQVKYGNNMSKKISFQLTAPFSMLSLCSSSWILRLTTLFAFLINLFEFCYLLVALSQLLRVFPLHFYIRLLLLPAAFLFDLLSEVRNYWLRTLCWFSCLPFEWIIIIMQFL